MDHSAGANSVPSRALRRDALLLALIAFVLGIVLAGAWFHHRLHTGFDAGKLSPATKDLMSQLATPVTIQYYSLLPVGSADESLQNFSAWVTQLLDALKTVSNGKLTIIPITKVNDTNIAAASAHGVQAFNLNKGEGCFLGLALASGNSKETFPQLQPEWEQVLQFDLARAISRVATANAPSQPIPEVAKPSAETIAAIHLLIPNVNAVTDEQAGQILHEDYLKQCGEVGTETQALLKAAQQKVAQAQASGSQTDIDLARKNLLQVQTDQAIKLKELADQLQVRLEVFQNLKTQTADVGN